jgi:hypothetical protein
MNTVPLEFQHLYDSVNTSGVEPIWDQPVTGDGGDVLIAGIPCDSVDPTFMFSEDFDLFVLARVEHDGRVVSRA